MKKTKIIATLGPAADDYKKITELIKAGINVFRLNFSHGDRVFFDKAIKNIKKARKKSSEAVAILQDLQGPKIRTVKMEKPLTVKKGEAVTICNGECLTDETNKVIAIDIKNLYKYIAGGQKIMINDGLVELKVRKILGTKIICSVTSGGEIAGRKGVNLPGAKLPLSSMTKSDRENLKYGLKNNVDIVCLSFVRSALDIKALKNIISKQKKRRPLIIAKIEKPEAVKNIVSILEECDGIMIARGDLAVEAGFMNVPEMQKSMIKKANDSGKLVIVATQMLESMTVNPYPERAEVTDVYNAVLDGADTLMLSGETAVGKYPVKTALTMADIIKKAEADMIKTGKANFSVIKSSDNGENALSYAAAFMPGVLKNCEIAIKAGGLQDIAYISDYRPDRCVFAVTQDKRLFFQMAIYHGIYPVFIKAPDLQKTADYLKKRVKNLEKIVLVDYHPARNIQGRITLMDILHGGAESSR